jgi:uncharacterized protein (DUF885 family)
MSKLDPKVRKSLFFVGVVWSMGCSPCWSQNAEALGDSPRELTPPFNQQSVPELVTQFSADQKTAQRRFRIPLDELRSTIQEELLQEWRSKLDTIDFNGLDRDSRIDWLMLSREVDHLSFQFQSDKSRDQLAIRFIPFVADVIKFCSSKEHGTFLDASSAATILESIARSAESASKALGKESKDNKKDSSELDDSEPILALRASEIIDRYQRQLNDTHRYYDGYDPRYMWWCAKPFESANQAIQKYRVALRESVAGISEKDQEKIVGLPIGNDALREAIDHAWLPYSAEELIRIGERELRWCDEEFQKAAHDLGCEGDWKKALELVKAKHVDPGDQPRLIRELAWEAIRFLEANDLVTVPDLAKHGWRLEMMSPEAQRVNPYFLGGENIIVSFPTNSMTHAEKLMSLKSNNIHFCRATVHHELIPGHHLQSYMLARYRPYRELFDSPFWTEGWALYWEMLLWDLQFAQSAEDRVGMLFWRRHRAARIIFSLNYQAGKWTAEECVQYLIDRVGHESSAAAAEVRRSIMGNYGPLYQAGYMLGGLQLRTLHKEIVATGKMTNRQFHDAILRENYVPFELLRLKLLKLPIEKNHKPGWRF